jgi:hypothetical protein
LIILIKQYGIKWKKIVKSFEVRNEVIVKNRWKYYLYKQSSDLKSHSDHEFLLLNEKGHDEPISKFFLQETKVQAEDLLLEMDEIHKMNH